MNNNFETELQKTIALFEILQKNLDYKTELKVYKAKESLLDAEQDTQKKLNFVRISLLYNFNFNYLGSYESIHNSLFTVYIKQDIKGVVKLIVPLPPVSTLPPISD